MPMIEIVGIAFALAMDAFAVSLAAGAGRHLTHPRPAFRLAFHLGLFQALMPVLGWFLGTRAAPLVSFVDHWLAFALLSVVGGRMLIGGLREGEHGVEVDPSRGLTMVSLSVATSIDAFAVGLGLAVLGVSIWIPIAVIGVLTAALSLVGISLGGSVGSRFGSRAELCGGIVLVAIGVRILYLHLMG